MPSISRWLTAALLSSGLLLAGTTVASAATPSSTTSTGQALLTASLAATRSVSSLHVLGSGTSSGKTVLINLTVGKNDAYGILTYSGQSTTIRRVGKTVFANSSKGFLQQQGYSASQAAVEANKWFKIPSTDSSDYQTLSQFLTLKELISGLIPATATGTISSVTSSTVGGKAVKVVAGTFSGQKGSFYILKKGKPYLVRILNSATSSGITLNFSNFNKSVHTTAPKGAVTQ